MLQDICRRQAHVEVSTLLDNFEGMLDEAKQAPVPRRGLTPRARRNSDEQLAASNIQTWG